MQLHYCATARLSRIDDSKPELDDAPNGAARRLVLRLPDVPDMQRGDAVRK
jgi:hypothetical protein